MTRSQSVLLGSETMIYVPGGTFLMGSNKHYMEESPEHLVEVEPFYIDETAVTNDQFAAFVKATKYQTVAERPIDPAKYPDADIKLLVPGSLVFQMTNGSVDLRDFRNWWRWTLGASWRHPEGPRSKIANRKDHPVVQVAYEDALAYAHWAGKDLPTEAEWEYAARGGLVAAEFAWGNELMPDGKYMANTWQGAFPWLNTSEDGYAGTCPVRSFPANGFGLYEMCGNVWEWTRDWFGSQHVPADPDKPTCCPSVNPHGSDLENSFDPHLPLVKYPRKTVKGGSFLCAPEYCHRYRPAARHAQMIDSATSHVGFRCIRRLGAT